jgi:trimethylamine--corrinoid protein Co-methyltransferase
MAAVREVGPQGHYLGAAHTVANYTSAFHMPELMDQTSFEQWEDAGSKDTQQLAFERVDSLLDDYEPPAIDDAVEAELLDYVARRLAEIPEED